MISLAFQTNKKLSEYGPLAQASEDYGFDAISVYNDMLYQPAWLPLYERATHTERLLVGTSGVNPYIAHPIAIAGNISTMVSGMGYELYPNVPNPFGSNTSISFFTPERGDVMIGIYDM